MNSTQKRREQTVKEFKKLVKCKADYTTEYMYSVVAEKVFSSPIYVQKTINQYYRSIITNEMMQLYKELINEPHDVIVKQIQLRFKMKTREARILSRYIKTHYKAQKLS